MKRFECWVPRSTLEPLGAMGMYSAGWLWASSLQEGVSGHEAPLRPLPKL